MIRQDEGSVASSAASGKAISLAPRITYNLKRHRQVLGYLASKHDVRIFFSTVKIFEGSLDVKEHLISVPHHDCYAKVYLPINSILCLPPLSCRQVLKLLSLSLVVSPLSSSTLALSSKVGQKTYLLRLVVVAIPPCIVLDHFQLFPAFSECLSNTRGRLPISQRPYSRPKPTGATSPR